MARRIAVASVTFPDTPLDTVRNFLRLFDECDEEMAITRKQDERTESMNSSYNKEEGRCQVLPNPPALYPTQPPIIPYGSFPTLPQIPTSILIVLSNI